MVAGSTAFAIFGSWLRPAPALRAHSAVADDCADGIRSLYYPGCPNPVTKPNYTPTVNGCGPEGGVFGTGINAVPNSPLYLSDFTEACNGHDRGYGTCTRPKNDTDGHFRTDMFAACGSTHSGSGMFSTMLRIQCKHAAQTYHKAVSDLGEEAYQAGQAAACDCCECKGAGGKCLKVKQYRVVQERVIVFCKYLENAGALPPPGKELKIAGANPGNYYQYSPGEISALSPECPSLVQLINQIQ